MTISLLHKKPILTISLLLSICLLFFLLSNYNLSKKINETLLIDNARNVLLGLAESQRLYSDDVANKIQADFSHQIEMSSASGSIPNPATFAIRLGKRLTKHESSDIKVRVYSDFPFKNRTKTGGVKDKFEAKALSYLRKNSKEKGENTEYYNFEYQNGKKVLRFTTPIIMKKSCVKCHNYHPFTTKNDWKIGDVRGVRAISIPTDKYESRVNNSMITSSLIILSAILVLLIVIWIIIKALKTSIMTEKKLSLQTVELNKNLTKQNMAISRFVPNQINFLLGKNDITELRLGEASSLNATILFSDIRSFTTISEQMKDEKIFELLNSYMKYMEKPIRESGGFIDKYIGDAIMAIFPNKAEDAIKAAIGMRNSLEKFNKEQLSNQKLKIDNGIGIHTGHFILGTVGVSNRMDGTAIGDTVNLAARLESITKNYKVPIIFSHKTYISLENPKNFTINPIDEVTVKGKKEMTKIYGIII